MGEEKGEVLRTFPCAFTYIKTYESSVLGLSPFQ